MKAMILDDKLNFLWTDVPDPVRKDSEVLIEVHAAAVNRADLMQKDGCYSSPPDWPQWCGLEVAGIVLEAPADAEVKAGDKVCALVGGGGYSEKIAVPAGMVVPIPEGLSMVEAASIPEVWVGNENPGDVFPPDGDFPTSQVLLRPLQKHFQKSPVPVRYPAVHRPGEGDRKRDKGAETVF